MNANKTICHHCHKQIVWNRCDNGDGYWAHPKTVFGGVEHTIENALMEQRCDDGIHWATPKRGFVRELNNEFAALVAVADAAKKAERILDLIDLGPEDTFTVAELNKALATLAQIQKGE